MSGSPTETRLFQGWRLNGRGQVEGLRPIPSPAKPDERCELIYDQAGRVVEVREYEGRGAAPKVRGFTYDDAGRVVESHWRSDPQAPPERHAYHYDERGHLQRREEYNARGKLKYYILSRCDHRGRIVDETSYTPDDEPRSRHVYELDDQGRVLREEVHRTSKGKTRLEGVFHCTYDQRGNLTRKEWWREGKTLANAFLYTYDDRGFLTEVVLLQDDEIAFRRRITRDAQGNPTQIVVQDGEGKLMRSETVAGDSRSVDELEMPPLETPAAPPGRIDPRKQELYKQGKIDLATLSGMGEDEMNALAGVAYERFESGILHEARDIFSGLVALSPKNPYFLSGLGAVYLRMNDPANALLYIDRALTYDPANVHTRVNRGEALLRLGRVEDALTQFQEVLSEPAPEAEAALNRARVLIMSIAERLNAG
jgi:hypothetical protein